MIFFFPRSINVGRESLTGNKRHPVEHIHLNHEDTAFYFSLCAAGSLMLANFTELWSFKGELHWFLHIKGCLYVAGAVWGLNYLIPESASGGFEHYKFENEKNLEVWSQREVSLPDLCILLLISAWGEQLEATLAATRLQHTLFSYKENLQTQ